MRTYRHQKGLTLQAGWDNRVDYELPIYRDIEYNPPVLLIPASVTGALTPIDLDAIDESEKVSQTDICRVCHIQHPQPIEVQELLLEGGSSSDNRETPSHKEEPIEENSDLDSLPELEDDSSLGTFRIPSWLIPPGVVVTFRGGRVTFEREQGPPWQEVLAHMLDEKDQTDQ